METDRQQHCGASILMFTIGFKNNAITNEYTSARLKQRYSFFTQELYERESELDLCNIHERMLTLGGEL